MLLVTFIAVLPKDAGVLELAVHLQLHPAAGDAVCFVLIADPEMEFEGVWFRDEEGGEVHGRIVGGLGCFCFGGWIVSRFCYVLLRIKAELHVVFGWRRRRFESSLHIGKI